MSDDALLSILIGCLLMVGLELLCVIVLLIQKTRTSPRELVSLDVPPPKTSNRTGPPENYNG